MPIIRSPLPAALLLALAAAPLAAQQPAPPPEAARRMPMLQTVTFDVAAAFDEHWRGSIEALVSGRFSIGLSGEFTTQTNEPAYYPYPQPGACPVNMLCADGAGAAAGDDHGYKAWSFNLHARWYPGVLALGGERQSAGLYFGEFIGYHKRSVEQAVYYYGCPTCQYPPPQDSVVYYPQPGGYNTFTQVIHGWEPGVELGLRLVAAQHIVIDVGGRFKLATIEDYYSGVQRGGVDKRLVVAVGVGW